MEGHYVVARSPEAARKYMHQHFPGERVHCALWRESVYIPDETFHYSSNTGEE